MNIINNLHLYNIRIIEFLNHIFLVDEAGRFPNEEFFLRRIEFENSGEISSSQHPTALQLRAEERDFIAKDRLNRGDITHLISIIYSYIAYSVKV